MRGSEKKVKSKMIKKNRIFPNLGTLLLRF